ncbi:unnamed protein product [Closterium sp. NIES-54]
MDSVDAVEPVEVAVDSGAATGAEPVGAGSGGAGSGGAETEGAEPGDAETGGAEPGGAAAGGSEPGGAEPRVTEPGGAEPGGAGSARVASRGASSRREVLSPQELREWFARRWGRAAGAGGTTATTCPGGAGAAGPGGPAEAAGVGPTGGSAGASGGTGATGSAGPGAAGATRVGAAGGVGAGGFADAGTSEGAGAGAAGARGATGTGASAGSPGAVPAGSGGTPRLRPYFVPLLEQVLGLPPSPGPAPSFACPQSVASQSLLPPVSSLPAPSPYTGPTGGLAERRAPASRPASPARPACTSRRTSRPRPLAVLGTHQMALRPSTAPLRVQLSSTPASSLPAFPDPESDSLRAASPTVARFLATVVTDPSLASTAASALVSELVDFAASCRLDYAASLVAESTSVCPPSVGGECALSTDVLEDRQEEFQCFAAALPHLMSTLLAPEGDPYAPDIPTPRSYAEAIEGRRPVVLTGHADASWADDQATQRSSQGYTFILGSGSVSWRSTRSSSVLSSSCEAEIYAGAMAAQELRWLTYLLTDLGEQPRSPPVLYVDNKAMLALCREHRLEHRTKHIALRYFLARELQQRGQLRLAYVASEANTADIFTKALPPGDHQRLCTMLGFPTSQPLALCLVAGDLAQTVLDKGGWQCVGVPGLVRRARLRSGATGAGGAGDAGARGAGVIAGVGGAGVGGTGAGGAGVAGAGAVYPGAGGARGTVRPRPYFVPLLQQVIGVVSSPSLTPFLLCPPPDQSQPPLLSASPLPAPSPYTEQSGNLIERRELASRPVSPLHTSRRVPRSHPPPVPGMHAMALLLSSRGLLAIAVTDPSFESAATSARVAELLDFATACRLNYASALVAMSATASPPSVGGECALGTDILEDRQEDFESLAAAGPGFASMLLAPEEDPDAPDIPTPSSYAEAITGPNSSHRQAAMDAEMASWKSTSTYVDEVPPPRANIVDGMWIFRVKRPPGYVAPGFSQTILAALGFAPSSADPSLVLRIDTLLLPFYGLVYVDDFVFATADTEALTLVKSELQKRHTCTDLGKLRSYLGLQITRDTARRTITLTQSHMVHQVLQRFGFQFSSPQPTPLSTSHSLSAPPSDKFVEPSGPYPELVGCLMYLMTCTRPDLAYPPSLLARYVALGRHRKVHWDAAKRVLRYLCSTSGMGLALGGRGPVVLTAHADASWVDDSATQRSSQGYTFSLGSGSVSLQSTCSSSILTSSCDTQIYAGAIAAQELRWLTYLLTDF